MTAKPVFISDRTFEIWRYTVSHRQLLLRSNKTNILTTRLEILFKDVSLVLMKPTLSHLSVVPCSSSELPNGYGADVIGKTLYRIEAEEFKGYIAAASVSVHEDEREYEEPSALLPTSL
jgi:hypothetical protein